MYTWSYSEKLKSACKILFQLLVFGGGFFGFSAYQYQVNAACTQTHSDENWPHLDMSTDKDSGCIRS